MQATTTTTPSNDFNSITNKFAYVAQFYKTLKRFRHPNIITLYGYNLNIRGPEQFLVYEYAANGSLDSFLQDDGNRARLPADTRLSIMFELARAVHFLHTGGCNGWKVFHRDIKSANIFLAKDFTVRLGDCGLAEFVPDDNSSIIPGSVTPLLRSTNGGPAFGTPGYMCPEYSRKKCEGIPCPYIAAFDVFSIGVVMVEVILGCLTGGQSTRNGMKFENALRRYVKDEDDELIVDGCKLLQGDVDPVIDWKPESLEQVCHIAIRCMAPSSKRRLSACDLIDELHMAITEERTPQATSAAGKREVCMICHLYPMDIECSKGHQLCTSCIGNKLRHGSGCQLSCLIIGCTSQPFQDKDLFERVSVDTYNEYIKKRLDRTMMDECLRQMQLMRSDVYATRVGVEAVYGVVKETKESLQTQEEMLQRVTKGLDRSLAALSLLAANQFKECPNLVWVTPTLVDKKDWRNPKKWITNAVKQKYNVVFICAHSGEAGHEPFEIEMPRGWIAKIAPWLKLCVLTLKGIASFQGLPFPIPNLTFLDQCKQMKEFLESVMEEGTNAILSHCETLLETGTTTIDTYGQMQTLAGDAFKFIAEKAMKAKRSSHWMPPKMVPVCDGNGTIKWVKGAYKDLYRV